MPIIFSYVLFVVFFFLLRIRRPPRSTLSSSSAASDVYKRQGFVTQNQRYSIAILNDRIDVNYNKADDSNIDIETFYDFSVKVLSAVMDYFGIASNRLAINIQQVCEFGSFEDLRMCGKKLVVAAAYYNDKEFSEWSMRTNSQVNIPLGEQQEVVNVITDISSGQDMTGQKAACLFHIDINTCLLYTSDAADEEDSVDLGCSRIIKKKKK